MTRPTPRPPSRLTVIAVALAIAGVFVAGLAVHGPVGGVLLLVVDAALVAISRAMWSAISKGRGLRVAVVAVIAVLAVLKLAGKA